MELRNKRKGVPAPQQESKPSKDSNGNTGKRVKSKAQHQPERVSRRLRSRSGEAGPSSKQEGTQHEKRASQTVGHRSEGQDVHPPLRLKQEVQAEPDHFEETGRQDVMAGSSGQAEQVRYELAVTYIYTSEVLQLSRKYCWFQLCLTGRRLPALE